MKVKQAWLDRRARRSPAHFRNHIRIDPDHTHPFAQYIQPWQQRDFEALDRASLHLAKLTPTIDYPSPSNIEGPNSPTPTAHKFALPVSSSLHPPITPSLNPPSPHPPLRLWIERPRGHSKTSDIALAIAWLLLYSRRPLEGIAAAADRDQASLLAEALQRIARANPLLCDRLVFRKHDISNPETPSTLHVISSDVQSSWGQLPDFIICDELCHWDRPDFWHSLLSSAAKRPHCLLIVLTNAGVGRDWHWQLRESARTSPHWHFSTLDGPQAPWITPQLLEEQRHLLPQPVFERLWLNRWQHSDGDFVNLAEADACIDPTLHPQTHGQPGTHYFAAIDYAEKHDHTVALLLHATSTQAAARSSSGAESHNSRTLHPTAPNTCGFAMPSPLSSSPHPSIAPSLNPLLSPSPYPVLIVDRLDLHIPTPDNPTPVAWVERWIRDIAARFHHVTFILDEYQLVGTIQSLQSEFDIHRFPFRAGRGNHDLAQNLRSLILHQQIRWYPACGQLPNDSTPHASTQAAALSSLGAESITPHAHSGSSPDACGFATSSPSSSSPQAPLNPPQRDDLATELASLLYRQSATGLCRIDHKPSRHDDRSFALGAAALFALESPPADTFSITPPTATGDFNFS